MDPTLVNFASCLPTVRGLCELLGDLEQQPAAAVTGVFVMVLGSPAAMEAAAKAAREATAAPATVYALADLDPAGALRGGPDSVHLVRPDGHLAAVLPRFERAPWSAAVRRACGQPQMSLPSLTAPSGQR